MNARDLFMLRAEERIAFTTASANAHVKLTGVTEAAVAGFVKVGAILTQGMAEMRQSAFEAAEGLRRIVAEAQGRRTIVVTGADGVSRVRVIR